MLRYPGGPRLAEHPLLKTTNRLGAPRPRRARCRPSGGHEPILTHTFSFRYALLPQLSRGLSHPYLDGLGGGWAGGSRDPPLQPVFLFPGGAPYGAHHQPGARPRYRTHPNKTTTTKTAGRRAEHPGCNTKQTHYPKICAPDGPGATPKCRCLKHTTQPRRAGAPGGRDTLPILSAGRGQARERHRERTAGGCGAPARPPHEQTSLFGVLFVVQMGNEHILKGGVSNRGTTKTS